MLQLECLLNHGGRSMIANTKTRIEWCDIFKGIAIVFMVVGHCTGRFNTYIYQFHMAAFFFISGYVRKPSHQSFLQDVFVSFCKTVWPFYMLNFMGTALYFFLNQFHVLQYVSIIQFPPFTQQMITDLLSIKSIPCDLFGATWFLFALFMAGIIFNLLIACCKKDWLILAASVLIFLASQRKEQAFFLDLSGIAQTYLIYGYLARKGSLKFSKKLPPLFWILGFILISILWSASVRNGFHYGMDWPSRQFSGPVDLIFPLWGICWTIFASKIIENIYFLKKLLIYIGKNSMAVMCFHFIGFKMAYILLIAMGKMGWGDFKSLVPSSEPDGISCVLIVVVSILCSLVLWAGVKKVKVLRISLGLFDGKRLYRRLLDVGIWNDMAGAADWLLSVIREGWNQYCGFLKGQIKRGEKR